MQDDDPTYGIELWEAGGGAPLATLVSGATLSSDTGEVVSVTWNASLLGASDGSAVELRIVGHRSGGNPTKRRTVEVGAIEWNVDRQGAPGSELYFLRARYYDPETGRFLGQDPARAGHPYAYVGNNPLIYSDPYGLDLCGTVGGLFGKKDVNCGDVVDEFIADPVKSTTRALDIGAAIVDTGSAIVTDALALYGCTVAPVAGCVVGYVVGWGATAPVRLIANFASGLSALITCADSFAGLVADWLDAPKDKEGSFGGGFGKSSPKDCLVSAGTATAGALVPEPNFNAFLADYQVCYDFNICRFP